VVQDVGCEDAEYRYGLPAVSALNERIALALKASPAGDRHIGV
jgi:hypothetical protein